MLNQLSDAYMHRKLSKWYLIVDWNNNKRKSKDAFTQRHYLEWDRFLERRYFLIDGLVQERRNSIANALELRISNSSPSICFFFINDSIRVLLKGYVHVGLSFI